MGQLQKSELDTCIDLGCCNNHKFVCQEASHFFASKGFTSVPQVLVNGVSLDLEEEDLETAIVTHMQRQTFTLQQALFAVCSFFLVGVVMS